MSAFDALTLARWQFGFTVAFHIVYPIFSIGLASYLVVLNGFSLVTGRRVFLDLFNYWRQIFAIAFGMGVVTGIVMSYQFGTNWSVFSDKAGPIIGPLMGYEVMSAFFLEAGFLGVMMFGRQKVGPTLHFVATFMVGLGTFTSAFWILSVNSWMQTPQGYVMNDVGQFIPADWWAIVFNPSFPVRFVHMVFAAYLTTAFVVAAVGALHLLRGKQTPAVRTMFSMAMWMACIVAPLQMIAGDIHGLNTLEHQPAKLAALEGHFKTERGASEILVGLPNMKERRVDYAIAIPKLGSIILTHSLDGELKGLEEWPEKDWPNVPVIFWTFRIMVGMGLIMLGVGALGAWLRYRGRLYTPSWFHRLTILTGPVGFIAVLCGWITTEMGRQPFVVYGVMRTEDAASPLAASTLTWSLVSFIIVYFIILIYGVYFIMRLMNKAPEEEAPMDPGKPSHVRGLPSLLDTPETDGARSGASRG